MKKHEEGRNAPAGAKAGSMKGIWIAGAVVAALALTLGIGAIVYHTLSSTGDVTQLSSELARRGLKVASDQGCIACHTLDGSPGIGPSWLGMYGRTETLVDGSTVRVDDDYIRESITDPAAKVVREYNPLMIRYVLSPQDMEALLEFTHQLESK